ncbi:unnamed protein product [Calypogeia fissa]
MESLLVRALESKLKYWLRSFSREQFKLQGRSVHLYNLDLNGDVLHAAIGLPPTLRVAQARVGKFELKLPSITYVNSEPIVVEIEQLDLVLVETAGSDHDSSVAANRSQPATPSKASTSYGFADKIADGMTIAVGIVNLMLETRGGGGRGGAAWTPPLASITIRNLLLYTTDENWKVVNLKEARDYFTNKKCIYVFKKLEWDSLSVDLLPHPDMFADENLGDTDKEENRDDAGAKRRFFGGERFLDNISGAAYITMHRTEQNNPLALEVQVVIPEALCPALSEPGLRALLRFMTGVYVCINRGDVDPAAEQSDEAAGRTIVKVSVDHIFLCIKDADFQLELLMQSLTYIRASATDGDCSRAMTRLELGHLFLRDSYSTPSCTLVQPSMRTSPTNFPPVPSFASEKLWPRIYPLDSQLVTRDAPPMLCMFSSHTTPAPRAPNLASQMVVQCQPLMINLQEEACIRIASFLADGVVVERGVVLPDTSLNAMYFSLKEFDLTVPLKSSKFENGTGDGFTGARLHVEGFMLAQSPFLSFRLLNLDEDPSCFAFWKGQPVDASQQRWVMRATQLSIALETEGCYDHAQNVGAPEWAAGLWRCVVMTDPCIEAAMVTADGKALVTVPPPGGIVRLGVSCKSYTSNTSSEQLLFVLRMYGYMGEVSRTLVRVSKGLESGDPGATSKKVGDPGTNLKRASSLGRLAKIAPDDSAVILKVGVLELKLLESVPDQVAVEGPPMVQISSRGISLKATHRMLGGAAVLSSAMSCQDIRVECVETELFSPRGSSGRTSNPLVQFKESFRQSLEDGRQLSFSGAKGLPAMRAVLWIGDERGSMAQAQVAPNGNVKPKRTPFLDISVVHMVPLREEDSDCHNLKVTAKIAGVRLGGGMVYTEALLHRFGVLGDDGGPGEGVTKVMRNLTSGPLGELLRPASGVVPVSQKVPVDAVDDQGWEMGKPDEIDVDLQLQDWLFALEGSEGVADCARADSTVSREQKCWHSTFRCLRVIASGRKTKSEDLVVFKIPSISASPVQEITVQIEGLQTLKPQLLQGKETAYGRSSSGRLGKEEPTGWADFESSDGSELRSQNTGLQPVNIHVTSKSGMDFAANLIENTEGHDDSGTSQHWIVESVKVAVKEPIEMKATKSEVEYLIQLGKLEVEAASRVAAGALKLLQLHGPVGQSAIDQLNSIGGGSLENILSPSNKRSSSDESTTPRYSSSRLKTTEPTLVALEAAVKSSKELCADLESSLSTPGTPGGLRSSGPSRLNTKSSLNDLSLVVKQLRDMEDLIATLRNDIQ